MTDRNRGHLRCVDPAGQTRPDNVLDLKIGQPTRGPYMSDDDHAIAREAWQIVFPGTPYAVNDSPLLPYVIQLARAAGRSDVYARLEVGALTDLLEDVCPRNADLVNETGGDVRAAYLDAAEEVITYLHSGPQTRTTPPRALPSDT